jgi:hypothetical protein
VLGLAGVRVIGIGKIEVTCDVLTFSSDAHADETRLEGTEERGSDRWQERRARAGGSTPGLMEEASARAEPDDTVATGVALGGMAVERVRGVVVGRWTRISRRARAAAADFNLRRRRGHLLDPVI